MIAVTVFALLGIMARIIVPYLQTLKANPQTKFDRAFILPAVVSVLIGLLTTPLVLAVLPPSAWESVTIQGLLGVFGLAWGATDISRQIQKVF